MKPLQLHRMRWSTRTLLCGVVLVLGAGPAWAQFTGGPGTTGGAGRTGTGTGTGFGGTGAGGTGGFGTGGATGQTGGARTGTGTTTIPSQSNPFRTSYSNPLMDGLGTRVTLAAGGVSSTSGFASGFGTGTGTSRTTGTGTGIGTGTGTGTGIGTGTGARTGGNTGFGNTGGGFGASGTGGSTANETIATFGTPLYGTTGTGTTTTGGGLTAGRTGLGTGLGTTGLGSTTTGAGFSTAGYIRAPYYQTIPDPETLPIPRPPQPKVMQTNLQGVIARTSALKAPKDVQVMVSEETVILRGTVGSERERRLAESLIRLTPGVRDVRNDLEIVAPKAPRP
jgi:hypothetical protein